MNNYPLKVERMNNSKNIVPISIFGIYDKYLRDWSGGRLCISSLDYFKITDMRYAVGYSMHFRDEPMSISMASKSWPYAVLATNPECRECGYAKIVLKRTLRHFEFSGLIYKTWVSDDNEASKRLLESCGLRKIEEKTKQRSTGSYLALLYSSRK
jgi:hypothetical protein